MRTRRTALAAVVAASALLLSACGGDEDESAPVESVDAASFPEGSTMARLAEAGR